MQNQVHFTHSTASFAAFMLGWTVILDVEKPSFLTIFGVPPGGLSVEVRGDATGLGASGATYRVIAPQGVDPTTGALGKPASVLSKRADNRGCMWLWSGYQYVPPQAGHDVSGTTYGAQGGINKLGSYYCWNRTYDVFTGRWTTPDPAATPWGNLWDYVHLNPVQALDSSGLKNIGIRIKETFIDKWWPFGDDNDDNVEDDVWERFKKILEAQGHTVEDDSDKHDVDTDARRADIKKAMEDTQGDDVFVYIGHGKSNGIRCFKPLDDSGDAPNELEDEDWDGDDFKASAEKTKGAVIILSCDSKSLASKYKNAKVRISFQQDGKPSTHCVAAIAKAVARNLTKDVTWSELVQAVNKDTTIPEECSPASHDELKLICDDNSGGGGGCSKKVFP